MEPESRINTNCFISIIAVLLSSTIAGGRAAGNGGPAPYHGAREPHVRLPGGGAGLPVAVPLNDDRLQPVLLDLPGTAGARAGGGRPARQAGRLDLCAASGYLQARFRAGLSRCAVNFVP